MGESLNRIRQQLNEFWANLTKSQKVKFISIVASTLILLVILTVVFTRPTMVPLYSTPLTQDQAQKVVAKLDESGYGYKLSDSVGGTVINVNQKDKTKIQLDVASVIKDKGMTYSDVFNSSSISTPNETRQAEFIIAKQDEMANALSQMNGIKDATINLSIPEKSLFIDDSQASKPTAAVTLTLDQELSKSQVNAVVDYVCKSVEGLEAENVSVMDSDLNPLYSKNSDNSDDASITSQVELKNKQTERLKQQVEYMLSNMGDNVKVGVNLYMDFDASTVESVKYTGSNPDNTGVLTEQQTTKKDGKGVEASGGVAGTDTNSTVTQYPSTSSGNNYQLKESTNNSKYAVDQVNTKTVKAIGTPDYDKSSIAVVLYTKGKEYKTKDTYNSAKPITKNRNDLLKVVQSGTGIQNVSITEVSVPQLTVQQSFDLSGFLNNYGAFILAGLLILGLLFGLMRGTKRKESNVLIENQAEAEIEIEDIDMTSDSEKHKFDVAVSDDEDVPEIDVNKTSEIQKQINKFVREKPDAVAQLLRNWLNDDWE